jgi:hypothetical protein
MNVFARLIVLLATSDGQLIILQDDLELIALEASYRQGNAQPLGLFRLSFTIARLDRRDALNVVGRVAVAAFAYAVDQPLHFFKAQQKRA